MFTVEEALCSVIWCSAVDGYAERDNRDAFTRVVYREAAAASAAAAVAATTAVVAAAKFFYTPDARAPA